jgi:hypothetical protein
VPARVARCRSLFGGIFEDFLRYRDNQSEITLTLVEELSESQRQIICAVGDRLTSAMGLRVERPRSHGWTVRRGQIGCRQTGPVPGAKSIAA